MTIRLSTGLKNNWMDTDDFSSLLNYGWLRIYSGSQPDSADDAEAGNLMMEVSERMAATHVSGTSFTVSGDQTAIFAAGRILRANVGSVATYGTSVSFTVAGDLTDKLAVGVSLQADCGTDGVMTVTVASASYDGSSTTTVNLNESITSNLASITWAETLTVASSSYTDSLTTVVITEDVLDTYLGEVLYGIRMATAASDGTISAMAGITMTGKGKRTSSGGYFRFYTNLLNLGESSTAVRLDGSFGTTGDLQAVTSSIQGGATSTVSSLKFTM